MWQNLDTYIQCLDSVKHLQVFNDAAERSVRLIKEYNLKSKNETQIQAICQKVKEYRKFTPDCTKESLSEDFALHIFDN